MTEAARHPWRYYLSAAASLRLAILRNIADYEFGSESRGRIGYLFDANIVQMFLKPSKEQSKVIFFEHVTDAHLAKTTALTAEFLFSRRLSAQGGLPPILSSGHADDVENILGQITARLHGAYVEAQSIPDELPGDITSAISVLLEAAEHGIDGWDAVVQQLAESIPEAASSVADAAVYEAQQFRRLLDDDMLRPIRLLPDATREVLYPDPRLVARWIERIVAEFAKVARPLLSGRRLKIERDARTLVQLLVLNETSKQIPFATRYVLVTADRMLSRAYGRWFWKQDKTQRGEYALRHPSQYVPLLNTQQLGGSQQGGKRDSGAEVIESIRRSLDLLFMPIRGRDYEESLTRLADRSLLEDDPWLKRRLAAVEAGASQAQAGAPTPEQLRATWNKASDGALVLNSDLLRARFGPLFRNLKGISQSNWKQGIIAYLDGLLKELNAAHVGFALGAMSELAGDPAQNNNEGASLDDSPLLARAGFERVGHAESTLRSKFDLAVSSIPPSTLHSLSRTLEGECKLHLIVGTEAYRLNQKVTAWRAFSRAAELARQRVDEIGAAKAKTDFTNTERDKHEAYYLFSASVASALEYARSDFEIATVRLKESMRYYSGVKDYFGLARACMQDAALRLSSVYNVAHNNLRASHSGGYSPAITMSYLQACDSLIRARESVGFIEDRPGEGSRQSLELEVRLGIAKATLYGTRVLGGFAAFPQQEVEDALRGLGAPDFPALKGRDLALLICRYLAFHLTNEADSDRVRKELTDQAESLSVLATSSDRRYIDMIQKWLGESPAAAQKLN